MPVYTWVAETRKGRTIKGDIEAVDEKSAALLLKRRNLTVKKLKAKPKDVFEGLSFMQPKVTAKDIVIFTRSRGSRSWRNRPRTRPSGGSSVRSSRMWRGAPAWQRP